MKAVINNKRYNTETAQKVAYVWNGLSLQEDFNALAEDLYKTAGGTWFIHGRGGARTEYAKRCGSSVAGSEQIKVLDSGEAKAWLEKHGKVSELEANFGAEIANG